MPPRPCVVAALIGLLPLLLSCATPAAEPQPVSSTMTALPAWLAALITKLESQPLANPPASVVQYRYAGATVYYLPPKCCDFPSQLLDADGQRLCSPDGGITGRGDNQCPDFRSARSDEKLVWQDGRVREPRR